MPVPYEKPHLTTAEQIDLLRDRGLDVGDRQLAEAALSRIGYYRLSEYWHPMRQSETAQDERGKPITTVLETFKDGARFADAFDLYVFDKRLRLLVLDARSGFGGYRLSLPKPGIVAPQLVWHVATGQGA